MTVATDFPDSVYADSADLCVEAGYSEVYLQFDLSAVPGTITHASIELVAGTDGSAHGSGAEAWAVSDTSWGEETLSWGARPGGAGLVLDRIGPIDPGGSYSLDVSAAVSAPGVYAFGLIPADTDTDGAHFQSIEAGGSSGPHLRVEWEEAGGGAAGDDSGGGGDGDGGGDGGADGGGGGVPPGDRDEVGGAAGCGCGGGGDAGWLAALLAGAAIWGLRRKRAAPMG